MDTTMLIPMLERLGWTSLQTVLLVALVYGLCRALPSLSAATRCRLWWLVSLQAVLGLFWSQPLQLAWLPAPQAVAMTATDVAADIVYPLAPEASAQLLAAMPLPTADVPAVAWWAVALAALWLSGVLMMGLRTFGEWRRCRALLAAAYPCEDEALVQALQLASDAHGVRPAPRLWMSAQVDSPQLVGPFRPVLLLPAGDNALQGDALDLALTHELQHLQRRDLQWGLLPALAQHLFFFHPLLRLSVREYAQAREEAVDAAVVGQHGASRQPPGLWPPVAAAGRGSAAASGRGQCRTEHHQPQASPAFAAVAPVLPASAGDGVDRRRGGGGRGADAAGRSAGAAGTACASGRTEGCCAAAAEGPGSAARTSLGRARSGRAGGSRTARRTGRYGRTLRS